MNKLILSVLAILVIATVVAGCESNHKTKVIPTPVPTITPILTPTPTLEPIPTPTLSPASSVTELEGSWTGLANNGAKRINFTFSGNNWISTDTNVETLQSVEMSGTFTIDTATNPKLIDIHIATSPITSLVGTTMFGLYEVNSSSLLLTFNSSVEDRPTDFTEALTYIKQSPDATEESATPTFIPVNTPTPTPTSSITELEGTWTETVAVPACMFTFSGNSFMLTAPCGMQQSGTFSIDSAANPIKIDAYITDCPMAPETIGTTMTGIYLFDGSILRIEMAGPGEARPSVFTGNELHLVKQPSSSDTELQGTWAGEGNEITFSGNNYTFLSVDEVQRSGTFSFNAVANPRTIDICVASSTGTSDPLLGKAVPGLYQLSGTNLTLVLGDPDAARPASLTDGTVFNLVKQ